MLHGILDHRHVAYLHIGSAGPGVYLFEVPLDSLVPLLLLIETQKLPLRVDISEPGLAVKQYHTSIVIKQPANGVFDMGLILLYLGGAAHHKKRVLLV